MTFGRFHLKAFLTKTHGKIQESIVTSKVHSKSMVAVRIGRDLFRDNLLRYSLLNAMSAKGYKSNLTCSAQTQEVSFFRLRSS